MRTIDAWKMMDELARQGIPHKKIAKIVAKNGYVSFKTGRPVMAAAVATAIARYRAGYRPTQDRNGVNTKRYKSRNRNRVSTITINGTAPVAYRGAAPSPSTSDVLNIHSIKRVTAIRMMELALFNTFGIKAKVTLPLDAVI